MLTYPAFGLWTLSTGILVWSTWIALRRFKSHPPHPDSPFTREPVTILKPLKGFDPGLEANLRSFFNLDYPEYELLFSVADSNDPAIPVVQRLITEYPQVAARLFIGDQDLGPNPKINNLAIPYDRARYDWVLISDSNIRVEANYLKRMMAHVEPDVGIVTAIVAGRHAAGAGGLMEAMSLNTFCARGMNLSDGVGRTASLGKSMLFRRRVAQRFGGLGALSRFLAEDYMAGEFMRKLGLRVVIMTDPVEQYIGQQNFGSFWQRHLRWGRIRKSQLPLTFYGEALTILPVNLIFALISIPSVLGISLLGALFLHIGVAFTCDYLLLRRLDGAMNLSKAGLWLVREFIALPLWIHSAAGSTVVWRGQQLKLEAGGILAVR